MERLTLINLLRRPHWESYGSVGLKKKCCNWPRSNINGTNPQPLLLTHGQVAQDCHRSPAVQIHLAAVTGRLLLIFNKCRAAVHAEALSPCGPVTPHRAPTPLTLALCGFSAPLGRRPSLHSRHTDGRAATGVHASLFFYPAHFSGTPLQNLYPPPSPPPHESKAAVAPKSIIGPQRHIFS